MNADPKWAEMADALLRVWNGIGWGASAIFVVAVLAWKGIDAWGKKPRVFIEKPHEDG